MVKFLAENGADMNVSGEYGSVQDIASRERYSDILSGRPARPELEKFLKPRFDPFPWLNKP